MSRLQWIKKCLTFLYNVFMNTVLFYRNGNEHQQVQDRAHEEYSENNVKSERAELNRAEAEDTVDFGVAGGQKNSLEKVSEAIYKEFVSNWHLPPEELQNQPLYKEINSGIQTVFSNIKSRARPLEEYEIIISVATGLSAHFKNTRKNKVTYRYKTRQEEVDFIRKLTKCLLDYWLPESMQRSRLTYVFITEIISVNVLEPMINNFSNFTHINEAIVEALDNKPAIQQDENVIRCDEKNPNTICSILEESNTTMESDDNSISRKKKKREKGLTKKWGGFIRHMRPRRTQYDDACEFRSSPCDYMVGNTSNDSGDVADQVPHDSEDNEILNTSIIDTSLQMWLQNNWTAKVSERLAEEEYEISVYDEPGTILWNTKRCLKDFKLIYERICQNWPDFKMFTKPNTRGPMSDDDSQFFFSIDTTPDEFIHKLLNLIKVKHEKEVVFFFSPFEYEDDDVRELVNCLPDSDIADSDIEPFSEQYNTDDEFNGDSSNSEIDPVEIGFKTYTKQDEKKEGKKSSSNDLQDTSGAAINKSKKDDESNIYSGDKENDSKDCYQHDGSKIKNLLRSRKKNKSSSRSNLPDMPSTSITRDKEFFSIHQPPPPITMDSTSSNSQKLSEKGLDVIGQNITQAREVKKDMEQQKQKLQETLLDALYHLIDEVIAGGKSRTSFLRRHGFLKMISKYILDSIPNIYAEEQIICYLNLVAELLTSPVRPQPLTPDVLQSKALNLLKQKVQDLLSSSVLKVLLGNWIMKNLKSSHQALEEPLANKETIYGLLEDLTRIITNEVSRTIHRAEAF